MGLIPGVTQKPIDVLSHVKGEIVFADVIVQLFEEKKLKPNKRVYQERYWSFRLFEHLSNKGKCLHNWYLWSYLIQQTHKKLTWLGCLQSLACNDRFLPQVLFWFEIGFQSGLCSQLQQWWPPRQDWLVHLGHFGCRCWSELWVWCSGVPNCGPEKNKGADSHYSNK